jgi:hypothetical protein
MPEIGADVDYTYDFRHPQDNTISGSSEVFRANEVGVKETHADASQPVFSVALSFNARPSRGSGCTSSN